jgi:hypothetical protein
MRLDDLKFALGIAILTAGAIALMYLIWRLT